MQINCVELVRVHFYARNVLYWSLLNLARRVPTIQIAHLQIQPVQSWVVWWSVWLHASKPKSIVKLHFDEYAEFQDADDMIQKLNSILSKPHGFPQIPAPRKDCHTLTFEAKKRHHQYVMCPEQDCESLVYFSRPEPQHDWDTWSTSASILGR